VYIHIHQYYLSDEQWSHIIELEVHHFNHEYFQNFLRKLHRLQRLTILVITPLPQTQIELEAYRPLICSREILHELVHLQRVTIKNTVAQKRIAELYKEGGRLYIVTSSLRHELVDLTIRNK
jgi:hypothetical protein